MTNSEIVRCKTESDVSNLITFFETVFSESKNLNDIKEIDELPKKIMLENINNDNYFMYFIKQGNNIIAGIRAFIIGETLRIEVLAVDKNHRRKGLSKFLINHVLDNSKSKIKEICVVPNKYGADDSFSYYIHNGFEVFLCLSCFENIDFEKYNKYNLKISNYKTEQFNDGNITKYYNTVKYCIDKPNKDYILYYENIIDNCFCYYILIKKVK